MITLYVPFSKSEANTKLIYCANQWKQSAYDDNQKISCMINCSDDTFASVSLPDKNKIYILCYEGSGDNSTLSADTSLKNAPAINTDELVSRLLNSKLPNSGAVEIKLCVKQKKSNNPPQITSQLMIESLSKNGYVNPNLILNVKYSVEPFPGKITKQAHYTISGTIPFFDNKAIRLDDNYSQALNDRISVQKL